MSLEAATYISGLNANNPVGASDPKSQGDDHLRLIKSTVLNSFPNITGPVLSSQTELNYLDGVTGVTGSGNLVLSNSPTFSGPISGTGSSLTDLNASNLTTGTVPDGRFPATLPPVSGANLTALNATQLTTGTVPDARIAATSVTQHQGSVSIAESQIPDGAILGRVAASETVTGVWAFSNGLSSGGVTVGWRSVPRSTTATTAAVGDVGKCIAASAGITIPNATFAAGDALSIYNDSASAITLTAGVTTLRLAGSTTTGNRTLAPRGLATVWFNSSSEAIVTGAGVS